MNSNQHNFTNFHEQVAMMKNHSEIVNFYIQYRNYLIFNDPEKALEIIKEGYFKYEKNKNEDYKYKLLLNWANTLIILEQYKEALEKMMVCLKYFIKTKNNEYITTAIGNTSSVFLRLEMFKYGMYLLKIILNKYVDPQNTYFIDITKSNIMMINMVEFKKIDFNIEVIEDIINRYGSIENIDRKQLQVYLMAFHNKSRYLKLKNDYLAAIQVLEQLLLDYEKHNFISQKVDVYLELGILYKLIDNEDKMVFYFKEMIKLGETLKLKLLFSNVYKELYDFYKSKNDYKKALISLEKYNKYKDIELELKKKVTVFIKELGFDTQNLSNSNIQNIFNNDNIESDRFLFCENLEGEILKIEALDIIYVQKNDDVISIMLSDNRIIRIKGLFKNFATQVLSLFPNSRVFFEANVRDTIISLFWLSKIDFENKKVFLRPYHNEIPISLSKRKWVELKQILKM